MHVQAARSTRTSLRSVWSSTLFGYANNHAMRKPEFETFKVVQDWINEQANKVSQMESLKDELRSHERRGGKSFVEAVDWSKSPKALLYGSCVQGTAESGGDADFAICFPTLSSSSSSSYSSESTGTAEAKEPQLIEASRFLQRAVILPAFYRQAGDTFPYPVPGLTKSPQQLHVDRIYHARVPILHYVPKQSILTALSHNFGSKMKNSNNKGSGNMMTTTTNMMMSASSNSETKEQEEQKNENEEEDLALPQFDVASCSSGCRNSYLLRFYFDQSPALRILVLALKRWARIRAQVIQAKKGWLSPYALTLMAVYWAQERKIVKMPHELLSISEQKQEAAWSFENSPLLDATKSSSFFDNFDLEREIALDNEAPEQECLANLLLDFFLFYSEEFDRDTQVVDIRRGRDFVFSSSSSSSSSSCDDNDNSSNVGSNNNNSSINSFIGVTTRNEWKEKVKTALSERRLSVFGVEEEDQEQQEKILSPSSSSSSSSKNNNNKDDDDDTDARVEKICRHLFGHDVVCVKDPVEAHSVTRNLDFFRTEALWEEFRLAAFQCHDPTSFLSL